MNLGKDNYTKESKYKIIKEKITDRNTNPEEASVYIPHMSFQKKWKEPNTLVKLCLLLRKEAFTHS